MSELKMTPSGDVIYTTIDNIVKVNLVRVNEAFTYVNKEFLKYLHGDALYFNNELYMSLENGIETIDGIKLAGFNDKADVLAYLKNHKSILVDRGGDRLYTVTYRDFKLMYNFFNNGLVYSPLLSHMLEHIESYIMTLDHLESRYVLIDDLDISSHIKLASEFAIEYGNFAEFLESEYPDLNKNLITEINSVYSRILNDIYKDIDLLNMNSISLSYESNVIKVTEYASPSSRRYRLNCLMMEGNEDGRNDI